ncbi:MAG TPA: hypothetical protein VEG61_03775, partial [Candidatus Dormibacteraeota bacterium]|nr:hypothetical protein [Candidatus Dormibacteraeota bacterium]
MRPCLPIITLALLIPTLMLITVHAQPSADYVVLYAHGYGSSAILTALPQFTVQKGADLTNGLNFKLSPVLGEDLQINGALTFNLYLRASGPFVGTVGVQIAEVTPDGAQTVVPGARVETPIYLNSALVPTTLGVGPVAYEFHAGSAILLHVGIVQTSGTGKPLLVWDDASAPTSVRLPTISPATVDVRYFGQGNFGEIFQANPNGTQMVTVNATLTDSVGVYRFDSAFIKLTATNGTSVEIPVNPKNTTDYATV